MQHFGEQKFAPNMNVLTNGILSTYTWPLTWKYTNLYKFRIS